MEKGENVMPAIMERNEKVEQQDAAQTLAENADVYVVADSHPIPILRVNK